MRSFKALLFVSLALVACGSPACSPSNAATIAPASSGSTANEGVSATPAPSSAASGTASASAPASATAAAAPVHIAADASAERARALAKDPPRPLDGKGAGFAGPVDAGLDGEWITRLGTADIVEVTPNRGGSSVSMRVKFADGKKAALKAEQTGWPTDPRSEIAAYHMDRLLGFGRTAAVVGRRFAISDLRAALESSGADKAFLDRLGKLVVRDDHVDAAMIAWHTAPLVEEEVAPAWTAPLLTKEPVAADSLSRLGEWGDLVVFDFLVDNPDRYSGGNILRLGKKDGPLVFLDQGAAFGKARLAGKLTTKERLEKVCRFRKETLAALRKVGPGAAKEQSLGAFLGKSVARDPIAPVLDEAGLAGVDERVKALDAHVRACAARLESAATLGR